MRSGLPLPPVTRSLAVHEGSEPPLGPSYNPPFSPVGSQLLDGRCQNTIDDDHEPLTRLMPLGRGTSTPGAAVIRAPPASLRDGAYATGRAQDVWTTPVGVTHVTHLWEVSDMANSGQPTDGQHEQIDPPRDPVEEKRQKSTDSAGQAEGVHRASTPAMPPSRVQTIRLRGGTRGHLAGRHRAGGQRVTSDEASTPARRTSLRTATTSTAQRAEPAVPLAKPNPGGSGI